MPKQKLLLVKRKCQKLPLKLVVKSAMLAAMLKNQLFFVSAIVHISRIGSTVQRGACNPLFQKMTVPITTIAMDDVICLGRRSRRASFAFSSYFSRLSSANSTRYKSFRAELKMANSKWRYRGTSRAFISLFDAVSCCLIQVQHRIRKKWKLRCIK